MTQTDDLVFNPNTYDPEQFDARRAGCCARPSTGSRVRARSTCSTTTWVVWPADFVDFVKRERLFATFLTPSEFADGDPNKRWDAARNAHCRRSSGSTG